MTLEQVIQWCADNYVQIGWGTHPRTGAPMVSMDIRGDITRDWEPADGPVEQFVRLVSEWVEKEKRWEEEPV